MEPQLEHLVRHHNLSAPQIDTLKFEISQQSSQLNELKIRNDLLLQLYQNTSQEHYVQLNELQAQLWRSPRKFPLMSSPDNIPSQRRGGTVSPSSGHRVHSPLTNWPPASMRHGRCLPALIMTSRDERSGRHRDSARASIVFTF